MHGDARGCPSTNPDADRRDPARADRRQFGDGGRRATDHAHDEAVNAGGAGFPCPTCRHPRTRVLQTRFQEHRRGYRRRRRCEACGARCWTFEGLDLRAVKKLTDAS
jgi:hypothetical protein